MSGGTLSKVGTAKGIPVLSFPRSPHQLSFYSPPSTPLSPFHIISYSLRNRPILIQLWDLGDWSKAPAEIDFGTF